MTITSSFAEPQQQWLHGVTKAASYLDMSDRQLYRLLKSDNPPPHSRIGRWLYFSPERLDEWMRSLEAK